MPGCFVLMKFIRKRRLVKHTTVYISDKYKQLIIASRYENKAGVLYEQEKCYSVDYPLEPANLGEKIIESLNNYSVNDVNLSHHKSSEWPAYKHSRCKTVREFEKEYISIFIRSVNESNLTLMIEGCPFKNNELTVNSMVSFHADKEEIGTRVSKVYLACLTGQIF